MSSIGNGHDWDIANPCQAFRRKFLPRSNARQQRPTLRARTPQRTSLSRRYAEVPPIGNAPSLAKIDRRTRRADPEGSASQPMVFDSTSAANRNGAIGFHNIPDVVLYVIRDRSSVRQHDRVKGYAATSIGGGTNFASSYPLTDR